jgi:hypothetical protein
MFSLHMFALKMNLRVPPLLLFPHREYHEKLCEHTYILQTCIKKSIPQLIISTISDRLSLPSEKKQQKGHSQE